MFKTRGAARVHKWSIALIYLKDTEIVYYFNNFKVTLTSPS